MLKVSVDEENARLKAENARLAEEVQARTAELQARTRELTEWLESQTATSDVLAVISSSPTQVQPVFASIAESAQRLCNALWGAVVRYDGKLIELVALSGLTDSEGIAAVRRAFPRLPIPGGATDRAILNRAIAHIPDILEDLEYPFRGMARAAGFRSHLSVPMLHDGRTIGAITVAGSSPGHFSERQTQLLRTFADQAVIAIQNARLFEEVQARTRELTDALEQQTATSEVLQVISRSAFDLRTVLATLTKSAAELCRADMAVLVRPEGDAFQFAASYNFTPEFVELVRDNPTAIDRGTVGGRVLLTGQVVHIEDVAEDAEYRSAEGQRAGGYRTTLGVPLLRDAIPVGALVLARSRVQPFDDRQIQLVTTFADQAVIAMENMRLFEEVQARTRELQETLEYQTATSDVLNVISRSPSDLQPVLDAVGENAARLCDANNAVIFRLEGDMLRQVASYGRTPATSQELRVNRARVVTRAVFDRQTVHIEDLQAEADQFPEGSAHAKRAGHRTTLATPCFGKGLRSARFSFVA